MEVLKIVFDGLVALGTLALAGATFKLVRETKQGREEERLERQRVAFRAALVEQLENLRPWPAVATTFLPVERLLGWAPTFEALSHLLGTVDLPGDLATYLVWAMAMVREDNAGFQGQQADAARQDTDLAILERLQLIACLLAREARQRGFRDIAEAFPQDALWLPWLHPRVWPSGLRATAAQTERIYRFGPGFPQGPAYHGCLPEARDDLAQQLWGQQEAALYQGEA